MNSGRTVAMVTALAGTLALSALTAPAAHAADTGIKVSNVVVNNGKPIVVGTHAVKEPPVTFRTTLPSGLSTARPLEWEAEPFLHYGSTPAKGADKGLYASYTCYEDGSRAADCDGAFYIDPYYRIESNTTTWKIGLVMRLWKPNGSLKAEQYKTVAGSVRIQRAAKATVNASPEPVKKGKTLTVTGGITRADWVKHKYVGYAGQLAKLQFRKKGSTAFTTVKTVRTNSAGALKTTVKASVDGDWRWTFTGTSTTGAATSAVDYVDVI